jgi:hypothetical protein
MMALRHWVADVVAAKGFDRLDAVAAKRFDRLDGYLPPRFEPLIRSAVCQVQQLGKGRRGVGGKALTGRDSRAAGTKGGANLGGPALGKR